MQNNSSPILEAILKELRHKGIIKTQQELADKLEYGKGYVSSLMKAAELPLKVQVKLTDIFGISREWLVSHGQNGSMFDDKPMKLTGDDLRKKKAFGSDEDDEPGLIYVPIAA